MAATRLTGSKIFISGGEQDMTENIVHLVLARLPDAPPGTKGISLFLAPKLLPDGTRNAIRCDGIEKKMGIKGSATCAMSFEGATGWLIGQPHRGLAAMFVMMNSARLHVAMQGQGHLEAAQQNALAYARERIQGRGKAIAEHPAMRRTLWSLRALAEGRARHRLLDGDAARRVAPPPRRCAPRRRPKASVGLLTPVAKAFFTDNGHRGADEALQVWGGYGFVHDYGIEQTVRDSRIAMIYEGTNQIQAIDLLQRKVLDDGGARLGALLDRLLADADAAAPALAEFADAPARAGAGRTAGHGRLGRRRATGPGVAAARRRRLPAWHRADAAGLGLAAPRGRSAGACRRPLVRRHAARRALWRAMAAARGRLALAASARAAGRRASAVNTAEPGLRP